MQAIEKPEYKNLVTFTPNKKTPVYNWLYYKEGYSRELALDLLEYLDEPVLDPFCGSGTTLLACQEKGLESTGTDKLPLAVFASRVKTRYYSRQEQDKASEKLEEVMEGSEPMLDQKYSSKTRKAFDKPVLKKIIGYRNQLVETENQKIRDFLLLALINASMKSSYAWKDGAVVKIKKRPVPPIEKSFRRQVKIMKQHLKKLDREKVKTKVLKKDARDTEIPDESIGGVMTSPPYLNKIDYTTAYNIEQELFFQEKGDNLIRSFFGIEKEPERDSDVTELLDDNPPLEALAYFNDMKKFLKELKRVTKSSAQAAVVIGGGCFPENVIQSDEVIAKLAQKIGFHAPEIWIARHVNCMKNRTQKVGETRESIVWLRKT